MRKREKTIAFLLALTLFVGAILPVYAGEIEEVSAEGEKQEEPFQEEPTDFKIYAGRCDGGILFVNGVNGNLEEDPESWSLPEEEWTSQWEAWKAAGFERWESKAGETVTLQLLPHDGYELQELQALDKAGNFLKLTETENGYQFQQPAADVLVVFRMQEPTEEGLQEKEEKKETSQME